jgi:putative acetyltransferase
MSASPAVTPALTIAEEDPRAPDVLAMIDALDARMRELYEPESCHLMAADDLVRRGACFLVARLDGAATGCMAFVPQTDGTAEVKRVWTAPAARGRGVARALMAEIMARAKARGVLALRLETSPQQPEALALFQEAGFVERGPFGSYQPDPKSIYLEKALIESEAEESAA